MISHLLLFLQKTNWPPYPSPHTFSLPSRYSSLAKVFSLLLPAEFRNSCFSSFTNLSSSSPIVSVFWSPSISVIYIPSPSPFSLPALWIRLSECCDNVLFHLAWGILFVDARKVCEDCLTNVYVNHNRVMKLPVPLSTQFRIPPGILQFPTEPLGVCHPWQKQPLSKAALFPAPLSFLHFLFPTAIQKCMEEGYSLLHRLTCVPSLIIIPRK